MTTRNERAAQLCAAFCLVLASATLPVQADDYGGKVWDYAHKTGYARISSACMSACVLRLRNGCVYPSARIVMHPVSGAGRHNARKPRWTFNLYPPKLRAWAYANGATRRAVTLKGAAMLRILPRCN